MAERARLALVGVALGAAAGLARLTAHRVQVLETERRDLQHRVDELEHESAHDPLTGLPNRRAFHRDGAALITAARAHGDRIAVLMVDLTDFKGINDSLGHDAGDLALTATAERLTELLHDTTAPATVCRLGGDEFAVAIQLRSTGSAAPEAEALAFAHAIVARIAGPAPEDKTSSPVVVHANVGLALDAHGADVLAELLGRADRAMYRAKRSQQGTAVYRADLDDEMPAADRPADRPRDRRHSWSPRAAAA